MRRIFVSFQKVYFFKGWCPYATLFVYLFFCYNTYIYTIIHTEAESKEKRSVWGSYAGVDYNFTICQLHHISQGQPGARVGFIPPSRTLDLVSEHSLRPLSISSSLLLAFTRTKFPEFSDFFNVPFPLS
jgi:hypothetical protein